MAVFHAAMQLYTENYPAEPLESFMVRATARSAVASSQANPFAAPFAAEDEAPARTDHSAFHLSQCRCQRSSLLAKQTSVPSQLESHSLAADPAGVQSVVSRACSLATPSDPGLSVCKSAGGRGCPLPDLVSCPCLSPAASRDSSDDTDTDSTEEGSDHECEAHRPKRSRGSTSAVCELAAAPLPFLDPSVAAALAASQLPAIKADLSAIWAPMGFQCPVPETSQPELAFAPIDEPPSQPTWMPQPAPPAQAPPRRPRQVLSEPPATVISVLPVSNTTTVSEPNIAPKDVSAPTTMPPPPPRTTPAIDLVAILGADAAATISLATHLPTPLKLHQGELQGMVF